MARTVRRAAHLVVVVSISVVAGLLVSAAPASAAGCPTAHGVTVVVDFHELGGGVQTGCVADGGGRTASELFPDGGFPLTYVQRQPGFVCRVSGKPADNPCVSTPPADAYWALYVSDGESGRWSYATSSAGGQHVPDGGYVAFSWQGSDQGSPPGYSPAPHPSASPTPTHSPSPTHASPSAHASQQAGQPSSASSTRSAPSTRSTPATSSTSPSASAKSHSARPRPSASDAPTATATESGSGSASPSESVAPASSDPADPGGGGLPGWVAPVVIVLLFGATGAVAVVRRRQGSA